MARKLEKKAAPSAAAKSAAEDLQALQPDATITIAGRQIKIREYGLWEGLRIAHNAKPLIDDMRQLALQGELNYVAVRHLFGKHEAIVAEASAIAADVDASWVSKLNGMDGELFLSTWLVVNGSFFGRELAIMSEVARATLGMASSSIVSSSVLREQESETSINSAGSPSAN